MSNCYHSDYLSLKRENAELKAKLAKGQESFELVLDNTASDKAAISLLCDALDEAVAIVKYGLLPKGKDNRGIILNEYRALAKQHKQE